MFWKTAQIKAQIKAQNWCHGVLNNENFEVIIWVWFSQKHADKNFFFFISEIFKKHFPQDWHGFFIRFDFPLNQV